MECRKCVCSFRLGRASPTACTPEWNTLTWSSFCSPFLPFNSDARLQLHTVGPIDVSNSVGKEVVSRLQCDIASAATMFTDSNGREMMRRVRNSVPTWNMSAHDPVPVNFYPVTSAAYIQDGANRMCRSPKLVFAVVRIIPTE